MTTKPLPRSETAAVPPPVKEFPAFPPRDDMQNSIILDEPAWQPGLRYHLGSPESTLVMSEVPLGWRHSQRSGILIPDLLIALNVDRDAVIRQRGYAIEEWGSPPDFVLEIASPNTWRNDVGRKLLGYARYRVPEVWLFDREWGLYYPTGLSGNELVGNEYRPRPIHRYAPDMYWGHSDALNLDLCWEYGELRWYDPVAGQYIPSYQDMRDARRAADARALEAEARIRELENENRRLRGQ